MQFTKKIFNEAVDYQFNPEAFNNPSIFYTLTEVTGDEYIIGAFQVNKNSLLYDALMEWYEYKGIDPVDYENDKAIYITHGCGYAIHDALIGGNGSSEAQNEFLEFLNK